MDKQLTVFIDGASRGNPGHSGAGVFVTTPPRVTLFKKGFYLKKKTNNQAEYLALIIAALWVQEVAAKKFGTIFVTFTSDSLLLVKQMLGEYKVKNTQLQALHKAAKKILQDTPHTFQHVLREKNTIADSLANEGTDKRLPLSPRLSQLLADLDIHLEQ